MARDTPGRDAFAIRQAARKKTLTMPIGRVNTDELKAATSHKPGSLRQQQLPRRAPSKNFAIDAFKAVGLHPDALRKTVSDAYWSVTHPKERLLGQERAKHQTMQWVGGLRPQARVGTSDPRWEIIRNKDEDPIVGVTGMG